MTDKTQEPVAWVGSLKDPQPHCVTDLKYCSAAQWDTGYHLKYIPLYTSPPASKPWAGLTDEEIMRMARKSGLDLEPPKKMSWVEVQGRHEHLLILARAIEAKLREKNA